MCGTGGLFLGLFLLATTDAFGVKDVVFVVLSQPNKYHADLANNLKEDIRKQTLGKGFPEVHLSHADFPHVGGWTIIPLIPRLASLHGTNSSFVFFMEDMTRVRVEELLGVLGDYENQERFLGFALHDNEPSIIHHFAFYNDPSSFKYPNVASGFAISTPLLIKLSKRLQKNTSKSDFNIDNSHELALFIWDEGNGLKLTHEPRFCVYEAAECVSYPQVFKPCGKSVDRNSIYFAVKTCEQFHKDRVPVVKSTWAKYAKHITFFSDAKDIEIPTVTLGIENTEHGHCEKTFAIIRSVAKTISSMPNIEWIVIADDDTILSVSGLQQLLSCYESDDILALGERYGYGVRSPRGYNYITGGGGMVVTRHLLELLADEEDCQCPSASSPDDMYLGFCLRELGVELTHSPFFHQARPADYATGYLESHKAVSFHKHWMVDPRKVYRTWFGDADAAVKEVEFKHTEL